MCRHLKSGDFCCVCACVCMHVCTLYFYVWLIRQWELSSLMPPCFQNWLGPPACLQALNFLHYQTLKIYWNVILHNGEQEEVNKLRLASKLSELTRMFIHTFYKYLLSAYYVLGTVLGHGHTTVNKTDQTPCHHGACTLVSFLIC